MSKRQADRSDLREQSKATSFTSRRELEEKNEMGEFEDNWEDEIEEDEELVEEAEEEGSCEKRKDRAYY